MSYKKILFSSLALYSVILNLVNADQDSPSVIIVGAGAAGVAAASKLFQNGFKNITILEAQDRIGGRIHTIQFRDHLVDLGAQWVHGEVENVAFELASPLGLLEKGYFETHKDELYDSSGTLVNQNITDDITAFYLGTEDKLEERNASLGEYITNELNTYFEAHPNWKKNKKGVLLMFEMIHLASQGADTWFDVSTSSDIDYHDSPGDFLVNWKERGYGTILDILMKRYPNPEEELPIVKNTILNTEVSLINNKGIDGKVSVTTTKGDTYSADHVIVTPSLGVLKEKYSTLFQPSLSEEKVKTIKALGFGSEAKIFLYYEEPWWTNGANCSGFNILWKDEDIAELENDPEKSWFLGLTGFNFVEHKPRLLFGWVSGKHAREMEQLPEQKVLNQSVEILQRFVGKYFNITTPTAMMRSMWNSNKHVRGTYSYRTTKAEAENVWHATLAEPIGDKKPSVLFAGEATSPHHFSTVHGAIETGWREANRLIQLYPNPEPGKFVPRLG